MSIRRREFITLLGGAAATWTLAARAQQAAIPVIGFLATDTSEGSASLVTAFRQGLQRTGFVEGRNVVIEYRYADNRFERLPALAADLIQRHPALIVSDPRATFVLKPLTATIPIIFVSGSDPVRNGFVARLDRPGGNLTGIALLQSDLTAKRFGIFRDMVPQAVTIGVLVDSNSPNREFVAQEVEAAARTKGVPIRITEVGTGSEIEAAFATFARDGMGAVFATAGFFLYSHAQQLAEQALRYRLPLTGEQRNSVETGALMFYGPPLKDTWIQVGMYAGRILKGEKPGDLPVQLPTKFELVINLKTAKALGLTVPPNLLATADEVIE